MRFDVKNSLPWLWLGGCLTAAMAVQASWNVRPFDGDMSSELALSYFLASQGDWVYSTDWLYSSELRVLNTQLVFVPLFHLFNDWFSVRLAGDAIMYLILLATFFALMRELGLRRFFPWLGGCLLLPLSADYELFVLRGVYYIPHISISFAGMAFAIGFAQGRHLRSYLIGGALLAFLSGLGGYRQVFILYLPLCLAAMTILLATRHTWGDIPGALINCVRGIEALSAEQRLCGISLLALLFSSAGAMLNAAYLSRYFYYAGTGIGTGLGQVVRDGWAKYGTSQLTVALPSTERLQEVVAGYICAMGYYPWENWLSLGALHNVVAFVLLALILWSAGQCCIHRHRLPFGHFVVVCFMTAGLMLVFALYLFTDMRFEVRYLLPFVTFSLPVLGIGAYVCTGGDNGYKAKGVLVACLCCTLLGWHVYSNALRAAHHNGEAKDLACVAAFLQENDYRQGYAAYGYANVLAELSDGGMELWIIDGMKQGRTFLFPVMQPLKHMEEEPLGRFFVLVGGDERYMLEGGNMLEGRIPVFQSGDLFVYGYESMAETEKFKKSALAIWQMQ